MKLLKKYDHPIKIYRCFNRLPLLFDILYRVMRHVISNPKLNDRELWSPYFCVGESVGAISMEVNDVELKTGFYGENSELFCGCGGC